MACSCRQRVLQIRRLGARRNQENKHFIAIGLSTQVAAKFHPAFSRQHPVENQKGKFSLEQGAFGLLGTADTDHVVAAAFNQALQGVTTLLVIFNQQDFHYEPMLWKPIPPSSDRILRWPYGRSLPMRQQDDCQNRR